MNPPAPAIPAPAPPPAARARPSRGLARRRKLLLAAEAAGIAGILVFAWMRDSPREATKARVAALAEVVRARFAGVRTNADARALVLPLRAEFPTVTANVVSGTRDEPLWIWCEDPAPRFRLGLARAFLAAPRPDRAGLRFRLTSADLSFPNEWPSGTATHFWATLRFDSDASGAITNITIERFEDVLGSASPTPW